MNEDNSNYDLDSDPNAPSLEIHTEQESVRTAPKSPYAEAVANVKRKLGSGPGRIAMFVILFVLAISLLIVVRGLNSQPTNQPSKAKVEVPSAPNKSVLNGEVTEDEHKRRAEVNNQHADKAKDKGESYIPPFDTNIVSKKKEEDDPSEDAKKTNMDEALPTYGKPVATDSLPKTTKINQLDEKQYQELRKSFDDEVKKRDEYVSNIQRNTVKQIESLLGKEGKGGINNLGTYSQISFYHGESDDKSSSKLNSSANLSSSLESKKTGKPLIKAGTVLFGQTDGAVNTDESMDVYGTIVGGEWDKSAIMGKVQRTQDNINLIFTVLSPKDDRPKMQIKAVALRLQDLGQGLADTKDYHTIERWGSLAVSSLLTGYGKAYQDIGTTSNTSTGTIQTKSVPSNKEIAANMLGEMGSNAASEIKEGFNRPPTYGTEEKKQFALYFIDDVMSNN